MVETLADSIKRRNTQCPDAEDIIAFPRYWQEPAATERAAYDSVTLFKQPLQFTYVGFPWATLIDGLNRRSQIAFELLDALSEIRATPKNRTKPTVTVAQHIHADQFVKVFKAAGVTDVFWSHAVRGNPLIDGVGVHPFPLYPAQAATYQPNDRPRHYLANFMGAYNPSLYLSNVRQAIFDDAGRAEDLLIVKRDRWHFDRAVYEEQIANRNPEEAQLTAESKMAKEYVEAIQDSWFTLCPTGSGPNSIRIFECLNLSSIPIILSTDLRLAGPRQLWEQAAIIEEDSEAGYRQAIQRARERSAEDRQDMLKAGRSLLDHISTRKYAEYITNTILATK